MRLFITQTCHFHRWRAQVPAAYEKTNLDGFMATIPDFIETNTTTKTNSGNQAVFSHKFVRQLTTSPQLKELFAIGSQRRESLVTKSKPWRRPVCFKLRETSLRNAVLSLNASICYKSEDSTEGSVVQEELHKAGDPVHVCRNEVLMAL